jgi:CRISPR-associated endonuclease/helicase Cas3
MLPVLADSIVVIDEVHSFDRNMFSALKEFLKNFCVPVMCMTATLPKDRRGDLEACGLKIYEEKPGELKVIAEAPRYTLTRIGSWTDAIGPVKDALAAGKRALWVTNTVRRCHQITAKFASRYDDLRTACGKPVYCYHSRFALADRVTRHNEIVEAMKLGRPAALGVTTQVCEMSLDLDVDLLVTEKCPVTSLIQRMGRCNRDRNPRPLAVAGQVLVYEPDAPAPYTPDDLKGFDEFLSKTVGKELSQSHLETVLYGLTELPPWYGDNVIMFLASGPYAVGPKADDEDAVTFREGNDFNRPCVLPDRVGAYLDANPNARAGFIVPVPKKLAGCRDDEKEPRHRELPSYVGVAAAGHYHPAVGYCDRPLTEWGAE